MIAQPARFRTPSASLQARRGVLLYGMSLILLSWMPSYADTRDQESIKADATAQIQAAAASSYYTQPEYVEVRLADKRLVLPDCNNAFEVTFPFSDRARRPKSTVKKVDCDPEYRYVTISISISIP